MAQQYRQEFQQVIPRFDGENYEFWRVKMETLLSASDLWDLVEEGVEKINTAGADSAFGGLDQTMEESPRKGTHASASQASLSLRKELRVKDMCALHLLHMAVTDSIFPRIATAKSSKEAWDMLQKWFQGTPKVKAVKLESLIREYDRLHMTEGQKVKDYFTKIIEIVNYMKLLGEEISDVNIVRKILISLPREFDNLVVNILETHDPAGISLFELIGLLQEYEHRLMQGGRISDDGAFQATQKTKDQFEMKQGCGKSHTRDQDDESSDSGTSGKLPPCGVCKKTNHLEKHCWWKEKPKCNFCRRFGHVEQECRLKIKVEAKVREAKQPEDYEFAYGEVLDSTPKTTWLVESACNSHMTGHLGIFKEIDRSFATLVRIGNGSVVLAEGKGMVTINIDSGEQLIKNVLYVPSLTRNILSVSQLVRKGYGVLFEKNECIILNSQKKMVARAPLVGGSFLLNLEGSNALCC